MSAKLHKLTDKTARGNPYTSHKVRGKIPADKVYAAMDASKTQPQLKNSAPLATSKSGPKASASHVNVFVPIPELGIYTPDQHVLQNGTFAQHCHNNRDAPNRMNGAGNLHPGGKNSSNISSITSCDETAASSYQKRGGGLHRFDSQASRNKNDPNVGVFHVPNSRQHNHSIVSQQEVHSVGRKPARNEIFTKNIRRVSNSVRTNKNVDNIKKDKMDPSSRSHSLSDLSTGLTLSLIGQKKYDSVVSVNSHLRSAPNSGSSRRQATIAASSLQDIEGRFKGTTLSCQSSVTSLSSLYSNSRLQIDQGKDLCNQYSSTSNINGHQVIHQTKQNTLFEQPYQQKNQNQQFEYLQHKPQLEKDYPVAEEKSLVEQQIPFPRSRKDSEDTVSSYRSALSDTRPFQDHDTKYNNRTNESAHTPDTSRVTSRNVDPFSSIYNTASCLKDNAATDKAHSAVIPSHQLGHQNREQAVVKPRRSLPNVPLNEASERIKRFTEMMKSRMSANSANKSRSADSRGSDYAPSRMSSTGSTCSQTGPSTQTPSEPSDGDVFVDDSRSQYQSMPVLYQQNSFMTIHEVSRPQDISKEGMRSPRKSSGYNSGSDSGAKHADMSVNRRNSIKEEVHFQNHDHRMNNSGNQNNSHNLIHRNLSQNAWHGQYQNMLSFRDVQPAPASDQSLDSGRTTETNNSYNGSILDSGYTTNNDGENDSCRSHPPRLDHYSHRAPKEDSQHVNQDLETGRNQSRTDEMPQCNHHHSHKYFVNLVNTHNFGSVQNIYQKSQAIAKDFNLVQCTQVIANDKHHQHVASQNPACYYNKIDNANITGNIKNGINQAVSARNMPPVNQLQLQDMQLSANRRSWDCANDALSNFSDGFTSNQIKRYERADERYRSSDVLPVSRGFVGRSFLDNHHIDRINRQLKTSQQPKTSSDNSMSDSEIAQLNDGKEFTPVVSPAREVFNHHPSDHEHPQKTMCAGTEQLNGYHMSAGEDYHKNHYYQLSNGNHQQHGEVKPQQVPVSKISRLAQGYTHPGGFGNDEPNGSFHHFSSVGQEMSLFHITQKYDLAPVMINLPNNVLLNDMIQLSEVSVEMSLVGVSSLPNSLHGRALQIGTPGSAFTPVKNSVDRDKPLRAELKVLCFSSVWEDIHSYTTLGRVLKGDIVLEVNGWFCLGADVAYVRTLIENCKETITLTVARLKETDDVRFKGQTAVERIKGLESEISRLDDLIQARDERIKSLTVAVETTNLRQHTGTLSEINGKIPLEGMIIGGDEYVV
ncbi:unnamed protein product [Candidula unifasciata]|uniref:PDZ domain-containing protein n=1 Tax=Candidula unifasciata TaxID=100452 RepID=A0A8S3YE59_9EUPU|nr:unnamed protein product [Candidula unifasciata]